MIYITGKRLVVRIQLYRNRTYTFQPFCCWEGLPHPAACPVGDVLPQPAPAALLEPQPPGFVAGEPLPQPPVAGLPPCPHEVPPALGLQPLPARGLALPIPRPWPAGRIQSGVTPEVGTLGRGFSLLSGISTSGSCFRPRMRLASFVWSSWRPCGHGMLSEDLIHRG